MTYSANFTTMQNGRYYPDWQKVWIQNESTEANTLGTNEQGNRVFRCAGQHYTSRGFEEYNTSVQLLANFSVSMSVESAAFNVQPNLVSVVGLSFFLRDAFTGRKVGISLDNWGVDNTYMRSFRSDAADHTGGWYGKNGHLVRGFRIRDDGTTRYYDLGFSDSIHGGLTYQNWTSIARTDHTSGPYYFGWTGYIWNVYQSASLTMTSLSVGPFVSI